MLELPKQLQQPLFRFAVARNVSIIDGKKRITGLEPNWNTTNNYPSDHEKIRKNLQLQRPIGIVVGFGDLIVIDCDTKSPDFETLITLTETLPQTFTVKTWSGGRHYYFFCPDQTPNRVFKNGAGELRAQKQMAFIPGTMIEGKRYEIMKDTSIAVVSKQELDAVLSNLLTTNASHPPTEETDKTRSGKEWHTICRLLEKGKTKEQVFQEMQTYAKWSTAPQQYREYTYTKALQKTQKKQSPKIGIETKTAKSLFDLKPDKNFLIDSFIYPKNIIMLFSPPKNYKSILALYLSMCLAKGHPFFGLKSKKSPVLYCDRENNENLIHQRLHAIRKGEPEKFRYKNLPLHFLIRQGDMDNEAWVEKLIKTIKENNIKLVIFDTMKRYTSNFDENDANDVNRVYMNVYQPITEKTGCSILFLHHTNRDGHFRGSGDFLGLVDSAYSISKHGKNGDFKIACLAARGGEIDEIQGTIELEQDKHKQLTFFRFVQKTREEIDQTAKEEWVKRKEACNLIMKFFLTKGLDSYRKKDITEAILLEQRGKISESTLKRAFQYLIFKKVLVSNSRGSYMKIGDWLIEGV